MVILGFDENVAALNGFALVTGPDGRLRSVSRDALEGEVGSAAIHGGMRVTQELLTSIEGASTQGQVVGGNCGWSYIYFNRIARLKGSYRTGFQLNEPAISYQWTVGITGPSAGWAKVFGGALAFATSWTSGERTYNAAVPGSYLAGVWTSSHAVLWTGGVCYSGGPTSVATL